VRLAVTATASTPERGLTNEHTPFPAAGYARSADASAYSVAKPARLQRISRVLVRFRIDLALSFNDKGYGPLQKFLRSQVKPLEVCSIPGHLHALRSKRLEYLPAFLLSGCGIEELFQQLVSSFIRVNKVVESAKLHFNLLDRVRARKGFCKIADLSLQQLV
jgi:hypothetical protein